MLRLISVCFVLCLSSMSFANTSSDLSTSEARRQIEEYKALRQVCADTEGAQRRLCFSHLSKLTESYIQAKKVLSSETGVSPLLGSVNAYFH